MMKLTLRRAGTFKCHWSNYDNRCGTDPQPIQEYRYICEIDTDGRLNENGFVIDQLDINKTMQELFYPEPHKARSCETIALSAVYRINTLLTNKSYSNIYRISVSVGVIIPKTSKEDALITAEWNL